MADIEAMFHQVRVVENQRGPLRFLWWERGVPRMEVEEFEMFFHLFGGKSSPSCSNYALKRTVDYQIDFEEDVAKTLQNIFYVDDMLKSSPDLETAIDLISIVRGLCGAGGFNLTKFASNNVEVMQAIPDEHVRKNVNLKQLQKSKSQSKKCIGFGVEHIYQHIWIQNFNARQTTIKTFSLTSVFSSNIIKVHLTNWQYLNIAMKQ